MQAKGKMIIKLMEEFAPPHLSLDWDNSGLQVGDPEAVVEGVMLSLDLDDQVCREAIEKKCQLIISHHPLFFKAVKQLNLQTPTGSLVAKLLREGIALYSAHTNLDSAAEGVNAALARRLGLERTVVLKPSRDEGFLKLVVFVPEGHEDKVREAISRAGAGWIGNYSHCTFQTGGTGTFKPREGSSPFIGKQGQLERVKEIRVETILPKRLAERVLGAMREAHPYEEAAYDLYPLEIKNTLTGIGRVGDLNTPVSLGDFARLVKDALHLTHVRYGGDPEGVVTRVALCGGSGADFWPLARAAGADLLVTGDVGYHTARDMVMSGFNFIDAGHYGTERVILPVLKEYLEQCFSREGMEVRVHLADVPGDPFQLL